MLFLISSILVSALDQHSSLNKISFSCAEPDALSEDFTWGYYTVYVNNTNLTFGPDINSWVYNDNRTAKFTRHASGYVSYTFKGTKVAVEAPLGNDKCPLDIYIDEKLMETADPNCGKTDAFPSRIIFKSQVLQYGNHTIKLQRSKNCQYERIALVCLYVQPQAHMSQILSFGGLVPTGNNGYQTLDDPTRYRGSAEFNVPFNGTRFWIIGSRSAPNGDISITVDGEETETVSDRTVTGESDPCHLQLLYSSKAFEFGAHTVTIKGVPPTNSGNSHIALSQFIYSMQPFDTTIVPIENMIKRQDTWILDGDAAYTSINHEYASTFMYGTEYWLFGSTGPDNSNLKIAETSVYDYSITSQIKSTKSTELISRTVIHNPTIDLNSYDLVFENIHQESRTLLNLSYFAYRNSATVTPDSGSLSIELSNLESDSVTFDAANKTIYIDYPNSAFFEYDGNKMWFEASVGPNFGRMNIYLNNTILSKGVSLWREDKQSDVIVYESPSIPSDHYTVEIMAIDDEFPVNIRNIYYLPPPTIIFTQSTVFTNSMTFSKSLSFSNSYMFTQSTSFSKSLFFTESQSLIPSSNDVPEESSSDVPEESSSDVPEDSSSDVPEDSSSDVPEDSSSDVPEDSSNEVPAESSNEGPAESSNDVPAESSSDAQEEPSNDGSEKNKGTSIGLIIGLVIGILVLIAIIILVVFIVFRKKSPKKSEEESVEFATTMDPLSMTGTINDSNNLNSEIHDPFVQDYE